VHDFSYDLRDVLFFTKAAGMPSNDTPPDRSASSCNVAAQLTAVARERPNAVAVAQPLGYVRPGERKYATMTFRELDDDSSRIAGGLRRMGVTPGMRIVLLVRPSIDFVSLVFALFKVGAVTVLIDPGMGRQNLVTCLDDAQPEGFVAIPLAQAIRTLRQRTRGKFAQAKLNVTVGRRWFWGGPTLAQLRHQAEPLPDIFQPAENDPAAIIFTTGSTGPPKGVLYRHGNFAQQVEEIRTQYKIESGGVDLACFPLFGLFNVAWGVTTVIPDLDASRPASVDPQKIVEAIYDWNVTQSFASPAVWNKVGRYCQEQGVRLPSLRKVFSAGAPVPSHVLQRMRDCISESGEVHTPYGATEALPVATISATDVLQETAAKTALGQGVCVGRPFEQIQWKVIEINDGPLEDLSRVSEVAPGQMGELIVQGPVVTTEYVTRVECNPLAKIADGKSFWHRMGDVGYLDAVGRFWFCGRMAHRVQTKNGIMFTIPCEAIFNNHPYVFRSALVGIGPPGEQVPVVFVEPQPGKMPNRSTFNKERERWEQELTDLAQSNPLTTRITHFQIRAALPVDIRHNAKIFREQLALEAARIYNGPPRG
jgi:acyl-CoA synthetase (AMP-forming)/AMP-acid ligase II